jgi:hypothetical protein
MTSTENAPRIACHPLWVITGVPFGAAANQVKNARINETKSAMGAIHRTASLCKVHVQHRSPAIDVLAVGEPVGVGRATVASGMRMVSAARVGGAAIGGAAGGTASIPAPVKAGGAKALPHSGHGVDWPADESGSVTSCWHDGHKTRIVNYLAARKARGK